MISSILTRLSAAVLLVGGLVLLFAPDAVLPAFVPGFPPAAAWLGQLLGGSAPRALWLVCVPATLLAAAYGALLLRGPFDARRPPAN